MTIDPTKCLERAKKFQAYKEKIDALLDIGRQLAELGGDTDWSHADEVADINLGELVETLQYAYPDKRVRVSIYLEPKTLNAFMFDQPQASQMPAT